VVFSFGDGDSESFNLYADSAEDAESILRAIADGVELGKLIVRV
jgi:hypothetical protein